jgi:hypothetical protein
MLLILITSRRIERQAVLRGLRIVTLFTCTYSKGCCESLREPITC